MTTERKQSTDKTRENTKSPNNHSEKRTNHTQEKSGIRVRQRQEEFGVVNIRPGNRAQSSLLCSHTQPGRACVFTNDFNSSSSGCRRENCVETLAGCAVRETRTYVDTVQPSHRPRSAHPRSRHLYGTNTNVLCQRSTPAYVLSR